MGRTRTSGHNAGNDRKAADAQEWKARAWALRRQGFGPSDIAKKLDRAASTVSEYLTAARKAVPVEDVEAEREQQREEIRREKRRCRRAISSPDSTSDQIKAAQEQLVKCWTREAKLLGLDAPEKHEVAVTPSDEQIAARLAALDAAASKSESDQPALSAGEDEADGDPRNG